MSSTNPVLFNYYISTQPQPLQTGDVSAQSNGALSVYIVPPTAGAFADEITIAVPIDTGGLFQQAPTCMINVGKWVVSQTSRVKGQTLGLVADQDYVQFILDCQSEMDYGITYNLVIFLLGAVTTAEGNYQLAVMEQSGSTNASSTFTVKTAAFTVPVVAPQFYLNNLSAYLDGAQTVPATEFANGADINLSWQSNGTWFQVYKKGGNTSLWSGSATTCTLAGGIATDTTFLIIGSMTGDPSNDQPGFEPVFLFDALTLTVCNPDLTPKSVTASGAVSGATLAISGVAGVTGLLTASGGATISGVGGATGLLTASGGAAISGGIFVCVDNGTAYLNTGCALYACGGYQVVPVIYAVNSVSSLTTVTGISSIVASGNDYGFSTNGTITSTSANAVLTHVPTRSGHRVVTSPIVLESEIHASGEGRLEQGRAKITLPHDLADVIHHSTAHAYRVQLTPTGYCKGLVVVSKHADHFVVEELASGTSEASFDWFLVARRPHTFGSTDLRTLPEALPTALLPAMPE